MKKSVLATMILIAISIGFLTTGCGESSESKKNIARQTQLMEEEAAARKKAEEEKQREIEDARKFKEDVANKHRERTQNTYGDK